MCDESVQSGFRLAGPSRSRIPLGELARCLGQPLTRTVVCTVGEGAGKTALPEVSVFLSGVWRDPAASMTLLGLVGGERGAFGAGGLRRPACPCSCPWACKSDNPRPRTCGAESHAFGIGVSALDGTMSVDVRTGAVGVRVESREAEEDRSARRATP